MATDEFGNDRVNGYDPTTINFSRTPYISSVGFLAGGDQVAGDAPERETLPYPPVITINANFLPGPDHPGDVARLREVSLEIPTADLKGVYEYTVVLRVVIQELARCGAEAALKLGRVTTEIPAELS